MTGNHTSYKGPKGKERWKLPVSECNIFAHYALITIELALQPEQYTSCTETMTDPSKTK